MTAKAYQMSVSAPEPRLEVGEKVRETYVVERLLGSGAFSSVYLVRHRFLGLQAMKVFATGPGLPPVDEILNEAQILTNLLHPCVVRVFEANTLDRPGPDRPYMTMEYAPGGTLESFLQRKVRLNYPSALKAARQLYEGLAVAHHSRPPIVHRDVKPQNILIWSISLLGTPQIKVSDFGLAKHVDPDSLMTRAAGTLHYMAPEAAWGFHNPASDVYSAGVVLFRLLTGVFPFALPGNAVLTTSEGARNAVLESRREAAPAPSKFSLGLPPSVDALVSRVLAPEPHQRFADAAQVVAQLDQLLAEF